MSKSGKLTIVLQAGGESRRMGQSKATVSFLGEPLIWRGVNRLLPLADEFIITTNEPQNLEFLHDLVDLGKIRLVMDEYDQRGALRGVYTAINAASNEYVAIVACDMIFPSRNLISAELEALIEEGTDVAIPKTKYGYEPFHAVYKRSTCLPVIYEATERGEVKANSWLQEVKISEFDGKRIAHAEPRGGCFINVNTPEELAHAQEKILAGDMPVREDFDA